MSDLKNQTKKRLTHEKLLQDYNVNKKPSCQIIKQNVSTITITVWPKTVLLVLLLLIITIMLMLMLNTYWKKNTGPRKGKLSEEVS